MSRGIPRAWRKGPRAPRPAPSSRDDEQHAADMERRAKELAPLLGFCEYCGATVDEPSGKLHAADCWAVAPERRRAS